MAMSIVSKFKHAWNIFVNGENGIPYRESGGYYTRPDRMRFTRGHERSIVTSVYNRIAIDVSSNEIKHVRLDSNNRYLEEINSGLNRCLSLEANMDQTGRALRQDIVMSLLDEGCVAVVPTDTDDSPLNGMPGSFDIDELRTGKVLEWYPDSVKVSVYDERAGYKKDITVSKNVVALIENPFFSVMNEPNSTLQRLIRKLYILDLIDENSSSGKLDLIIQLPYVIKTEARKQQAEARRKDIEQQLSGSKYGIAYTDGTEKITQLNRAVENNLMSQIEYLTRTLYSQLGITSEIMDGTANEQTMLNYYNRTIEPILSAIVDELKRKFLTKTARSQGQSIMFFRDPFKMVTLSTISDISDRMTRNEIMTSNEIRQIIGLKPSEDPNADKLLNSNMPHMESAEETGISGSEETADEEELTDEELEAELDELDALDADLDALEDELNSDSELKHYASPYYDPVKAHEYYMEHRKLKGRRSTAQLNEEGKEVANYVKEQINAERDKKIQEHKDQTESTIYQLNEWKKSDIKSHKEQTKSKIKQLQSMLRNMSKSARAASKDSVQAQIDELREQNSIAWERINEKFSTERSGLREAHKTKKKELKAEYEEKYLSELDKIKEDPQFQKVAKSSSGSSKKSKGDSDYTAPTITREKKTHYTSPKKKTGQSWSATYGKGAN